MGNLHQYSLAALDATTQAVTQQFSSLSQSELNWKPNAESWSIAQNIDHLIVINESYFPILKALHQQQYKVSFLGKIGFITDFMGNFILKSVEPSRKQKIKTFPVWQPQTGSINGDIIKKFVQHQTMLKQQIVDALPLLQKGTVVASPANKNIVYTLDKAFEILITHEQRHLAQAQEMWSQKEKTLRDD
ncbi:MAG: DinB family protein [Saprospiraceae bacterium]|nr:DinB family protein [Saprospiraceae bacterium]MBP7699032.1 DinB family protein [Saprospiraceae bacterium]